MGHSTIFNVKKAKLWMLKEKAFERHNMQDKTGGRVVLRNLKKGEFTMKQDD